MEIGVKGNKHYYLKQNPLTKDIYITVNDFSKEKTRTYKNKNMIRKIFCMFFV